MSVLLIIGRVQTELEDFGATWTNPDYICRKLAIVNDDLEQEFQDLDLSFDTQVVILPAIAADTTDLSQFQIQGGPLASLVLPLTLEWRLSGENQQEWEFVPQTQKIIDTDTGTGLPGVPVASDSIEVESWTWRAGIWQISPSSQVIDLRATFQSLPTELNADSPNQPIRGVTNLLVYAICESIAGSRGGETSKEVEKFNRLKLRAVKNFQDAQIKAQAGQVRRLGGRRSGVPFGMGSGFFRPGSS